ncbi:MAG: hypothetical protein AAGL10_08265 [Pseudomonadota bacterium]
MARGASSLQSLGSFHPRHSELVSGFIAALALLLASPLLAEPDVPHPDIPCWLGERTASASGDEFTMWETRNEAAPYLITHNREQMLESGEPTQLDYNYLTYWLGDESDPIQARHYLDTDEVSLLLPDSEGRSLSLEEARAHVPAPVLCYLQKRFFRVTILTDKGNEILWDLGGGN